MRLNITLNNPFYCDECYMGVFRPDETCTVYLQVYLLYVIQKKPSLIQKPPTALKKTPPKTPSHQGTPKTFFLKKKKKSSHIYTFHLYKKKKRWPRKCFTFELPEPLLMYRADVLTLMTISREVSMILERGFHFNSAQKGLRHDSSRKCLCF